MTPRFIAVQEVEGEEGGKECAYNTDQSGMGSITGQNAVETESLPEAE